MLLFPMQSKKEIETIAVKEGQTLEKAFENYTDMAQSASDWTLFCPYQFRKNSFIGTIKVLELPSMQIIYLDTRGGSMFELVVPEACFTIALMQNISNKACIDEMKLRNDMIVVIDDTKIYNFMYSDAVTTINVSFKKNANQALLKKLRQAVDKYYLDNDKRFSDMLKKCIDTYSNADKLDHKTSAEIEKQIVDTMLKITHEQDVTVPHFTRSEKIAIKIKKQLFSHMDGTISIASFAEKHHISERSLQNAFRSLFDLTPVKFIRLLKLNHVHHELTKQHAKDITVSRVAQKWGFKHMGKFSQYYTELFGENPSVTLKRSNLNEEVMSEACVQRREEI